MPCYFPILIKNKHYDIEPTKAQPNKLYHRIKRNLANKLGEHEYIRVPCGKCFGCLKKRRQQWSVRISNELKVSESAFCLTLTYDEENCPYVTPDVQKFVAIHLYLVKWIPNLSVRDIQLFKKRLRSSITYKLKDYNAKKLKFFVAPEYGGETGRPHYHIMVFNFPKVLDFFSIAATSWSKGNIYVDSNPGNRTINYMLKYILKPSSYYKLVGQVAPRAYVSPNLGLSYIEDPQRKEFVKNRIRDNQPIHISGFPYSVPRYYRDKLLDPFERMRLNNGRQMEDIRKNMNLGQLRALYKLNEEQINKYSKDIL